MLLWEIAACNEHFIDCRDFQSQGRYREEFENTFEIDDDYLASANDLHIDHSHHRSSILQG